MKTDYLLEALSHPSCFAPAGNYFKVLRECGGVEWKHVPITLLRSGLNLANTPNRLYERLRWGRTVDRVRLQEPPIFILGHWRSGTTYLHNLLAKDRHLGFVTTLQAFYPAVTLQSLWLLPLLRRLPPQKRHGDNVLVGLEDPQEEEFALAILSPLSLYHFITFPRSSYRLFSEAVLFEGVPDTLKAEWQRAYLRILKTATLIAGGRRLVLKNPCNAARIPQLLELFPEAKFIHIYRNPCRVYYSTRHYFLSGLAQSQLQSVTPAELDEAVFHFYEGMMRKYWATKDLIPEGNLVEIRYEEFERDPLRSLAEIYEGLKLPGFDGAKEAFEGYIASQASYQQNRFSADPEELAAVTERLRFALDRLGYDAPEGIESGPRAVAGTAG
ncbi:MAG: sulfotransferase [Acidobacteriota bacterium]